MPADNELELYINNDGGMYREYTRPLHMRLAAMKDSGKFDRSGALRSFTAIANEGAKRYAREFPGTKFSPRAKADAAKEMLAYFEREYGYGNIKPDTQIKAEVTKLLDHRRRR